MFGLRKTGKEVTESHNYGVPVPLDLSPEDRFIRQIVINRAKADPRLYTKKSPQQVEAEVRKELGL